MYFKRTFKDNSQIRLRVIYSFLKSDLSYDFLSIFRVWDVRSGRGIHKLKGHKVLFSHQLGRYDCDYCFVTIIDYW